MTTQSEQQLTSDTQYIDAELVGDRPSKRALAPTGRPANYLRSAVIFIFLPAVFLGVTLLGGFRLAASDSAFLFLKPPLICLVLAAVTMILVARARLIDISGWLNETNSLLRNSAAAALLVTLFTATVQVYNSVLPEAGLVFWIVGFFFVWTLWNNLFAEFDPARLLKSLGAMLSLAFITKYLFLANLTAQSEGNFVQRILENPGKEAMTYFLDLPKYAAGTGYVQFFTIVLYLLGLYLTPARLGSVKD